MLTAPSRAMLQAGAGDDNGAGSIARGPSLLLLLATAGVAAAINASNPRTSPAGMAAEVSPCTGRLQAQPCLRQRGPRHSSAPLQQHSRCVSLASACAGIHLHCLPCMQIAVRAALGAMGYGSQVAANAAALGGVLLLCKRTPIPYTGESAAAGQHDTYGPSST
jgi:hypothetical protein